MLKTKFFKTKLSRNKNIQGKISLFKEIMESQIHLENEPDHEEDLSCLEVINKSLSDKEGIVNKASVQTNFIAHQR